jgi:co-chaperonin GroES (HSP10)
MSKATINIDKLARDAMRDTKAETDYVKHPEKLPVRPFIWQVVIEPKRPKETSDGGIVIARDAQKIQEVQTTIGVVVALGPLAFTGKSQSGADMSRFSEHLQKPKDLIGVAVLYQRYTGLNVHLKNGRKLLVLDDTNLMCDVPLPDEILFYYD